MRKRIFIVAVCLLLFIPSIFAEGKKRSPVDFNIQIGASTSPDSITSIASNMEKLGQAAMALEAANQAGTLATSPTTPTHLGNLIDGYNGAAQSLSHTLAAMRFAATFQLGFKPINNTIITFALGASSGLRLGGISNVVSAAQGAMVFFDIPVHAYLALTLFDFIRVDGMLGMIFSTSTKELSEFTSNPGAATGRAEQLLADAYNAPKFDMVLRLSLAMFYVDLNGVINLEEPENLSALRIGLGINISLF